MTSNEIRQKYLDFFKSKGHTIIPSASLIPENDPTVLFTTAGMHPLVPYLLGETHPGGKRLANVQKCVRTGDIDDVGDNRHLTFFEMLGNWSLGDYFKKEAIEWSFEFLTDKKWLGLDPKRLYITVFAGDEIAAKDEESIKIWQEQFKKIGIKAEVSEDGITWTSPDVRIFALGRDDNWWGPAGQTGPCGPCTEMFYNVRPEREYEKKTHDKLVKDGRFLEIWNDVFMEFNKAANGNYEKLAAQNVDTGMGVERTAVVLQNKENVFDTDTFLPLIKKMEEISGKKYGVDAETDIFIRIVVDHIKAATFMIADGAIPSNIERGYILRRLIRRAVRQGKLLEIENDFIIEISKIVIEMYKNIYPELEKNKNKIFDELEKEEKKFKETLEKGIKKLSEVIAESRGREIISGENAFKLFSTYGFPVELTQEIAKEHNLSIDMKSYYEEFKKHQELSRTASAGQFASGLADHSEQVTKLHTATHLLNAALRKVLGGHISQKGSNITAERLRFDFSHPQKMTDEEIKKVEDLVNEAIKKDLPVSFEEMTYDEAKNSGAIGVFEGKYGDKVKVYTAGDSKSEYFSKEICAGPHIDRTGELRHFKITKEESVAAGIRRIKAILK
jgi:alanyl-tRNA synthetase